MANININNLSGFDLFNDSESFLTEISDESNEIIGGLKSSIIVCTVTIVIVTPPPPPPITIATDPLTLK